MAKLNLNYVELNKMLEEKAKLFEQMEDFSNQLQELKDGVSNTRAELTAVQTENVDMKSGNTPMNAFRYLQNEAKIGNLEKKLQKAVREVEVFSNLENNVAEDVFTPLVTDTKAVYGEFSSNALEIQKRMFKALKEVEQCSDALVELSSTYHKAYRDIPHTKAQYHTFSIGKHMNDVLSRFGIGIRGRVSYNNTVTAELYDFEK